ncbi:MAG: hypothetical protein J5482_05990 [Oscillospiraceae bacterium]|nr:hypothetical protein [Oscillospiraceae bacterium]
MIELKILVDEIDYSSLTDVLVPLLAKSMKDGKGGILGEVLAKNPDTAVSMARTILSKISQEKKDELLMQMMDKYRNELLHAVEKALAEHAIQLKLCGFSVEKR